MASISYAVPSLASVGARPAAGSETRAASAGVEFPVVNPASGAAVRSYDSGYGREVSRFGTFEFVNVKSVLVGT